MNSINYGYEHYAANIDTGDFYLNTQFYYLAATMSEAEQMINELFDGITDNDANGLLSDGDIKFYIEFREPVFLHSLSLDINSTLAVNGAPEMRFLTMGDFPIAVSANDTLSIDFKADGGVGYLVNSIEIQLSSVRHVGEIKMSGIKGNPIFEDGLRGNLHLIWTTIAPEPSDFTWSNVGNVQRASKGYRLVEFGMYLPPLHYNFTTVPSNSNVSSLFDLTTGTCLSTSPTELVMAPSFAMRFTTVYLTWDSNLPGIATVNDTTGTRPTIEFASWDGSAWVDLVKTSIFSSQKYENHQIYPAISRKLKMTIDYHGTAFKLCEMRFDALLMSEIVLNGEELSTTTTSSYESTSTSISSDSTSTAISSDSKSSTISSETTITTTSSSDSTSTSLSSNTPSSTASFTSSVISTSQAMIVNGASSTSSSVVVPAQSPSILSTPTPSISAPGAQTPSNTSQGTNTQPATPTKTNGAVQNSQIIGLFLSLVVLFI